MTKYEQYQNAKQDLFDYLHDQHDLILVDSELEEVVTLSISVHETRKEANTEAEIQRLGERHYELEKIRDQDGLNGKQQNEMDYILQRMVELGVNPEPDYDNMAHDIAEANMYPDAPSAYD